MGNKKNKTLPETEENPDWLLRGPEGGPTPLPVVTKASELPFTSLPWRDFERLCRRLAQRCGKVEHVLAYGTQGQAQYGIDILVRLTDGTYEVWQTKRYKRIRPSEVKAAVDHFLAHRWKDKAKKFVLAIACNLDTTRVIDMIEETRDRLAGESIVFEPIDGAELSKRLIVEPEIVDDYFGRHWAEELCPLEARAILAKRLSRFGVTDLRHALREWYTAWVAMVDPGLPVADLSRSGHATPAIPIGNRYVRPDVLVRVVEPGPQAIPSRGEEQRSNGDRPGDGGAETRHSDTAPPRSARASSLTTTREQRVDLDRFLSGEARSVISAEAGMGKTTLLRVIALDVLAEEPELISVRQNYKGFIPVWVPFALWTRMAAGRSAPPSLDEVVKEFFIAQSEHKLSEELVKALNTENLLLLVDGLDEASDATAARTVATVLATYAESRNLPVLVTSRPHGLQAMGGFASTWARVELAHLSDEQRHALAKLWFGVIAELEGSEHTEAAKRNAQAERRAGSLTEALKRNSSIARLSQTPLFLLALMQLHRSQQELPRSRFAAVEKIVEQLVEHQPRRRAVEALQTVTSAGIKPIQRDRLLDDFAFALHSGELIGPVTDAATEESAITRAAAFVEQRQGSRHGHIAEEAARFVFAFAEERAGLLVKKASGTIGFLHLSIQEFLAARHLAQRSFSERIAFIRKNAEEPRWREPILYLLYLETNEGQVGEMVRAIEKAVIATPYGQHLRDTLLIDAVFSDFAHDITVVREIAGRLFDEVELKAWGERQRHILVSGVDGLASEAVAPLCESRIIRWIPNRHGYQRASAIYAMRKWPTSEHVACRVVLLRLLAADEEPTQRAAAEVLAELADPSGRTKDELKGLVRAAPSVVVVASALYALGCGWANDTDVGELAAKAREASEPSVGLEGIRIRAKRNETDDQDFERFFKLTYSDPPHFEHIAERRLIEHFAETRRADFKERLAAKIKGMHERNPNDLIQLIGSLILCDPQHSLVAPGMMDLLTNDWIMREIFEDQRFPTNLITWTPELVTQLERFALQEDSHLHGYELYWMVKANPLPVLKVELLKNVKGHHPFRYWEARALVEVWGGNDPEVRQALLPSLDRPGDDVAEVAEFLLAVCEDKQACRAAFLRALRSKPRRVDLILRGIRKLDVANDDEVFEACLSSAAHLGAPVYQWQWREQMLLTFPERAPVRDIAWNELHGRDAALGSIALSYASDEAIITELLRVLAPLPEPERLVVVTALQRSAMADDRAVGILEACREDTKSAISTEATIGWMQALTARDAVKAEQADAMVAALGTVGHDYDARRTAAVIALAIAGQLDRFAQATEQRREPLNVRAAPHSFGDDNRYLRRILHYWPKFCDALGGEEATIQRLQMSSDTVLPLLSPNEPNAEVVFDILMKRIPTSHHLAKHVQISALAQFAPKSQELRAMILTQILEDGEYWSGLIAAEVLAEQFGDDTELRDEVIAALVQKPQRYATAAALAELLLRKPDAHIERLLVEKTDGINYDIATHFKLVAARSPPKRVVDQLCRQLSDIPNVLYKLHLPRWVPAIIRRIENDAELRAVLKQALMTVSSTSVKASFFSLLASAGAIDDSLRAYAAEEMRRADVEKFPEIGFDLVASEHRVVSHVLANALV